MREQLLIWLRDQPLSASELETKLHAHRTTITRHLKSMPNQVVHLGRNKSSRWFRLRDITGHGDNGWPLYRVTKTGQAEHFANLYSVYPNDQYVVEYILSYPVDYVQHESLPWWMSDMRPQGFLGRLLAESSILRELKLDIDPDRWTEDDVLRVLIRIPHDSVGNLLVGEVAYNQWLTYHHYNYRREQLETLVQQVVHGDHWQSTPGGEHAKLAITLEGSPAIIKFTGPLESNQNAQRWADLLHCEAIAGTVLNSFTAGLAASNYSFSEQNRVYLCSPRFDRVAELGRVGVVSLKALDAEFAGLGMSAYPDLLAVLQQQNIITDMAVRNGQIAWVFGTLIGNNDMHFGNLSVLHEGQRPFELAPIYDCLPMAYAPRKDGSLPQERLKFELAAGKVSRQYWLVGHALALQFWQAVAEHDDISDHFKQLAALNRQGVLALEPMIKRMA